MGEGKKIYSVTFHVKPRRKLHTFWFTNRRKALAFYESVKKYPTVLDYRMVQIPIENAEEYDGVIVEGLVFPVEV